MLLREAKEILKKNGYELVEVYDAVTDRNNIKNSRQNEQSYFTKLMKRQIMDDEQWIMKIIENETMETKNDEITIEMLNETANEMEINDDIINLETMKQNDLEIQIDLV